MSQGNQSCLRFSLEESVWFQRGQEVAELVSISLDPNITIQENEQYVSIIGSLELTGEYTCFEQQKEAESEDLPALKYVQSVMEREEGVYQFIHRFPVDITIPMNRIESIDNIDINVESFDYDFPEKGRIKLNADIAITGLYGDQQHEADHDSIEAEEQLEITYRESETSWNGSEEDLDFPKAPAFSIVNANLEDEVEEAVETDLYAPFNAEAKKVDPKETANEAAFEAESAIEVVPEYAYSDFRSEMESPEAEVEEVVIEEESVEDEVEESAEESSSSPEMQKKKKPNMKKGISIAEFLARKEEPAQNAQIRVCIVQQGDTLELLSERYDVPIQQLLRVNNLSIDHEVSEGQVLYVPGVAVQS